MKIRVLFLAFFSVLFLHSAIGFGASGLNESELFESPRPQNHADISVGGNHLFGLTPETEYSISGLDTVPLAFNKNFTKYRFAVDVSASLHLVQFTFFAIFYKNCLIYTRKSDGIFPFHYFW